MTAVASQEELIALVREKGPDFGADDVRDIGDVGGEERGVEVSRGLTTVAGVALVAAKAGVAGVAMLGVATAVGVPFAIAGSWLSRKLRAGEGLAWLLEQAGMRKVGQVSPEGPYASTIDHQVAHTFALAGFFAAALLGAAAAFAIGTVLTGGGLLLVLGVAAASGFAAGFLGTAVNDALSSLGSRVGPIAEGSEDVFIGGKGAARWVDGAKCSKDPPMQIIVEGSDTIFVNNLPLARVGHKLLCGAVIDEGEPSVIVDRTTRSCAIPKSEVPLWAHVVVDLANLVALYRGLKKGAEKQGGKFTVDPRMQAADEAAGVLVNGNYIKNPTAQNLAGLVTETGKIGSSRMNGKFMYVVDDAGNIIIGTRAGQHMPHPTLIGGANPTVQAAGMVDIRGGRIFSVDNVSGHFKPDAGSLGVAERAFSNLPTGAFHKNFQGYLPFE